MTIRSAISWLAIINVLSAKQHPDSDDCRMKLNETCAKIPQKYQACFGTALPYTHTTLALAKDSNTFKEIHDRLQLWQGLMNVPQCWAVIQPFLCSIYLPKCNDSYVELPSKELCQRTRKPCRIVEAYSGSWPDFLKCDKEHFRKNCKPALNKVSFNKTSKCEPPLIPTENKDSWYEDVEGCGLQCQNPLFNSEEHHEFHLFIAVVGSLCLVCTLFTVLTFIIDWKIANRYPAIILFFINACFFMGSIGWLAQFASPSARDDIVCRKDGTMRISEPQVSSGETASCTVVFFMVYYFMMAGITWFVVLAYAWYLMFRALGTPRDEITEKTAYFHIISWSLPLVMTIICLTITEIDGDSLSGICFVGYINHGSRAGFVLLPVVCVLLAGGFFLIKGLITLIKVKRDAPSLISDKATAKIRETIFRLGIFTLCAFTFILITFTVHLYIFTLEPEWQKSFKDYVICRANVVVANNQSQTTCEIKTRPNVAVLEMHVFSYFGAGIVMSSWVWNKASYDAWKRFFRKILRMPINKPVKLKKHKMIAKAFAKRHQQNTNGRMSISFVSTHEDPMGMKFDMNSASSHEMSSAWAQAFPKIVRRRGGMLAPVAGTLRRYSDSDIGSINSLNINLGKQETINVEEDILDMPKAPPRKKRKKKKKQRNTRIEPGEVCEERLSIKRRVSDVSISQGSVTAIAEEYGITFSNRRSVQHGIAHNILSSNINVAQGGYPRRLAPLNHSVSQNRSHKNFLASSFIPGAAEPWEIPEVKTKQPSMRRGKRNTTLHRPNKTGCNESVLNIEPDDVSDVEIC